MFKFEKGDHVSFVYGSVFSPNAYGAYQAVVNGGKVIARKGCGSSGGPEYRVAGFSGWWAEENLVLVSRGSKNSPSCDEAGGPTKDQPGEPKRDTGDSGEPEDFSLIISELSDLRARFNVFDDEERAKYHALSVAIKKLREELENED